MRTVALECVRCHRRFSDVKSDRRAPDRMYCPQCGPVVKREQTRQRVREYRKRQRGQTPEKAANKRPDDNLPRPAADGSRSAVLRATPALAGRGLFGDMPDPGRTVKRKAMGLP